MPTRLWVPGNSNSKAKSTDEASFIMRAGSMYVEGSGVGETGAGYSGTVSRRVCERANK